MLDLNRTLAMSAGEYDLLTVGELLVDMIAAEYGDHHDASVYRKYFGGSPANIAMNAKKLGIRPQLAAAVGADGLGKELIRQVCAAGIEPDLIETVEHATSLVLVTKSRSTPVPIFYRSADYRLSFSPGLERRLRQSKMLHFSSWPISMPPSRGTIERMVEIARENGIWVGFDPNYHPMLWPKDEDGVGYIKAMIGKADIVKPSDDDAERLFGQDTPDNHIRRFLDLGAKLVILTLGKDGALVSNGKETIRFPSLATEVEDTTGAGDAFWSGLYAALAQGCVLREAIRTGLAASAFKLKYTGALADLPPLDELKARYGI